MCAITAVEAAAGLAREVEAATESLAVAVKLARQTVAIAAVQDREKILQLAEEAESGAIGQFDKSRKTSGLLANIMEALKMSTGKFKVGAENQGNEEEDFHWFASSKEDIVNIDIDCESDPEPKKTKEIGKINMRVNSYAETEKNSTEDKVILAKEQGLNLQTELDLWDELKWPREDKYDEPSFCINCKEPWASCRDGDLVTSSSEVYPGMLVNTRELDYKEVPVVTWFATVEAVNIYKSKLKIRWKFNGKYSNFAFRRRDPYLYFACT